MKQPRLFIGLLMVGAHVFIFYTYSGTNNRTGMGAPPTGKAYKDCQGLTYFRTEEGKIKHQEFYFDDFYALKQLGYTLAPPAPEEASVE